VWKNERAGSLTPAFLWAQMLMIMSIREIVVPVRPIPAEQCTIDFSVGPDLRFQVIKWSSMPSKSAIAWPSGTP